MTPEEEAELEAKFEGQQWFYNEFVRPRLDDAKSIYTSTVNAIWIANGSGTVASLAFIGATWTEGKFYQPVLFPFAMFSIGSIVMGLGAFITLIIEAGAIRRLSKIDHVAKMNMDDYKDPWSQAGLSFSEWRTRTALTSAALFIIGLVSGFFLLLCNQWPLA